MKTAFIIDSSASISQDLSDLDNVYVVDLSVAWNGKTYNDTSDEEIMKQFYHELEVAKILPGTSQPEPAQIIEAMNSIIESGYENVIGLTMSATLSGTHYTMDMITREFSDSITTYMVDSKGTSYVIENMLKVALELLDQDHDIDSIIQQLEWLAEASSIHVVIRNLANLVKGGRLGSASAFIGSRLKIFPVLKFNDEGSIEVVEKVRTLKKVYKFYLDLVKEANKTYPQGFDIAIAHGDCEEDALTLRGLIDQEFPGLDYRIGYLTPVLGSHGGPGALGMGILPKVANYAPVSELKTV